MGIGRTIAGFTGANYKKNNGKQKDYYTRRKKATFYGRVNGFLWIYSITVICDRIGTVLHIFLAIFIF